jgi:NAD(P)H-flavin reductase
VPWPTELGLGKDIVFVAGGLGLAPLRPAILHVLAHRMAYKRVHVLYGARSPAEILYSRDLERWRGRLDVSLDVTVDRADSTWFGHVGVVTALVARAEIDPAATVAFVCGPEVMMRATVRALVQRGVPVEATYLSMERNMKCAVGICGHCQLGGAFVCKDGPVFRADRILPAMATRER